MSFVLDKKESQEIRKKLSIDLCDNFIRRLKPYQSKETKLGALIAIRNLIRESKINDPILFSCLVDAITDSDSEIVSLVIKIIKEVSNADIIELLNIKLQEVIDTKVKKEIEKLVVSLS